MEKKRDIPAWAAITITVFLSITASIAAYSAAEAVIRELEEAKELE